MLPRQSAKVVIVKIKQGGNRADLSMGRERKRTARWYRDRVGVVQSYQQAREMFEVCIHVQPQDILEGGDKWTQETLQNINYF